MSQRYVIVGSGIAGLAAAEAIREADARGRITLVSREPWAVYSRPGLAYLLTGEVPEAQLAVRRPEEVQALRLERIEGRAASLLPAEHALVLADGRHLAYDRLLLATGAASIPPDFAGADLEGVVRLDGLADARRILALARRARSAVVVGGGSTALEIVEGLHARGVRTHYLLRGDRYWSKVLDPVESAIVEARLEAEGVVLHRRTEVQRALGQGGCLAGVETRSGERIACDLLAVAIGVRPRLELARAAGLAIDRGVLANEFLETSAPDVFAAGDVAQVLDPATGRAMLDTLWSSARSQGRIAGLNMAGTRTPYRKGVPLNITRLAGVTTTIIGAVGGGDDPDLLTITRGQSERWREEPDTWSLTGRRQSDRLRVLVGARTIVGAVVMGDQALSRPLVHLIAGRVDISAIRPALEARPEAAFARLLEFHRAWQSGGRTALA